MKNRIIPYNSKLKEYARQLRNNSTLAEVLIWQKIKGKSLEVEFHRQVPVLESIVDFFCHELRLAIEIDGESHEYKYEYDQRRQSEIEKYDVTFVRFTDLEVKKEMFSVMLALEQKIYELVEINKTSP